MNIIDTKNKNKNKNHIKNKYTNEFEQKDEDRWDGFSYFNDIYTVPGKLEITDNI